MKINCKYKNLGCKWRWCTTSLFRLFQFTFILNWLLLLPKVKPCNGYCINIMKGCMAHHYQVNAVWNQYIGNAVQLLQAVFFRCEIVSLRTIFYLICVEVLIFIFDSLPFYFYLIWVHVALWLINIVYRHYPFKSD